MRWRAMKALPGATLLLLLARCALAQTPIIAEGGVVDAASFRAPVVPGSLVAIFGSNLASVSLSANTIPLHFTLGAVSVSFNGVPAPLLYVSPQQINAQLPWDVSAAGPVNVVVTNGSSVSVPQTVQVAPVAPAVYGTAGHAVAINLDGSLAAPAGSIPGLATHSAVPGDTIILLASGLGTVNPPAISGNNSLDTLRSTVTAPIVSIGGVPAAVAFSGLSPQFVGVYQLNVVVPSALAPANAVSLNIGASGFPGVAPLPIAVETGWPQWGHDSQHTSTAAVTGQSLNQILASITYDPNVPQEQAATYGDLTVHYQVPLVDGNDVYMEFKSGSFSATTFASQIWGESKFTWQNGQLVRQWQYASDWKAPGSSSDFWEPVFHAALANDAVYVPGASGSIIKLEKATGAVLQRIAPFGVDPNTYETGPIAVDSADNLFYNVVQVTVDPVNGFYANDATNSWLVRVTPGGSESMAEYSELTSPEAPSAGGQCLTSFDNTQLPWPPSPSAIPHSTQCGTQRAALNVSPAVAPDGTIYTISRAHFSDRDAFLVALNPDLTKKWVASLRNRFNDGCGVAVASGGWLPSNGSPGGCRAGALVGVDPATNQAGSGRVLDDASSSPVVAPDGTILFGAYSRYNYAQGHMMHFDAAGNYLGAFGFGWDTTPAIYAHNSAWSLVTKDNHYGDVGSYCDDNLICPSDRNGTNPASPEQYLITQLDANLNVEWSFQNSNTESCTRSAVGSLTCVSDHPHGFEWCVNSPAVDANGVVYANSEDGNLYAIEQGGALKQNIFQNLAVGAAYTPASLGGDGKVYSQNDGVLFVVGTGGP